MRADHVFCNNCGKEMKVLVGTEVCPRCKNSGVLSWVDENVQEVDVPESEIINLEDYDNVINETEEHVD